MLLEVQLVSSIEKGGAGKARTWRWPAWRAPCFSQGQRCCCGGTFCRLPYLKRLDWPASKFGINTLLNINIDCCLQESLG